MEKHRILIVDDEPNVRSSLARLLQQEGYDTLLAESAEDGMALLQRRPVSAVFSDYRMPGRSGIDFLTQIKTEYPALIRILLTDRGEINEVMPAVDQGLISHLLMKPWDDETLKKTLGRLVEEFEKARLGQFLSHGKKSPDAKRSTDSATIPSDDAEEGVIVLDEQETAAIPDEFLHFIPPH